MRSDIALIDKQIAELEAKKKGLLMADRENAIKRIKEEIEQYDLSAEDLGLGRKRKSDRKDGSAKPRAKAAPKYQNPGKPAETWSGRGRKPRWVEERLKAGALLDEFLIKSN